MRANHSAKAILTAALLFGTLAAPRLTAAPATTTTATDSAATATTSTATESKPVAQPAGDAAQYDAGETRRQLNDILRRHPDEVAEILKLNPTLFHNEAFMAPYPELRQFIEQHPEVPQNPSYYLENVFVRSDAPPSTPGYRIADKVTEGVTIAIVVSVMMAGFGWLLRTVLEHRRWSRATRVQTEIHNKLLDRFANHEDLLRYVESAAGKQFIQTSVMQTPQSAPPVAAPLSRMMWALQIGIVLAAFGIGLQIVGGRVHPDVAPSLTGLGVLALSTGFGFALAAVAGYVVSRKVGLLPSSPKDETSVETHRTITEQ